MNNKELEALEEIRDFRYGEDKLLVCQTEMYSTIKQALQRLESIDNANPSEALKKLDDISYLVLNEIDDLKNKKLWKSYFNTIKQTILKSQEQEKKNAYIEKIKTMMKQKDCVLRYIESEDCFAVKTILSDGWYKLTPELVENNVREEIKPLPLIEKNKQLKEENAEYKRVLEIIKEKRVITDLLISNNLERYNYEIIKFYGNYGWTKKCFLTQEEFDTLKRYLG